MAPSRRRGAGKAAAAARRQWKVGDLVLAKVKGFPAWPATVSEPEKWGFAADWKKVLVYFFGTQQIAFCNPVDVEEFTEEKKQSLLIKRQGRGADFVRAVQEIINCYENSKKLDQVDELNSGEDVCLVNGGHLMESSAHFELKDQKETPEATVTGRNDPTHASSVALEVPQSDFLCDQEGSLDQPFDNVAVKAKPLTTYTSRKRSGGLRSRKCTTRRNDSSKLESCRSRNFMIPSDEAKKSDGNGSTDTIPDKSVRRNERIRKSRGVSEWEDVDSSAFVSSGSNEDNGSEIVTVDSDSSILDEGSSIDNASNSKSEHPESFECSEGDTVVNKELNFQINTARKRRKPKRKQVTNEGAEPTAGLEVAVHTGSQINGPNSQNACEHLNERHNKEDGDKHLPLVKRARVRMGKLSYSEEHARFSQAEEKTLNEVAINTSEVKNLCKVEERTINEAEVATLEQIVPSADLTDDGSADKCSFSLKGASDNASAPEACAQKPANNPQLLNFKDNQSFGGSADGEAVLPPSKRLHRALEAMSANVAESQVCAEACPIKTSISDGSTCSTKGTDHVVIERKESNDSGEQNTECHCHMLSAFSCGSSGVVEELAISPLNAQFCNERSESSTSQRHHEDILTEALGLHDDQDPNRSCSGVQSEALRDFGIENPNEDVHNSECSHLNSRLVLLADEATKSTCLDCVDVLQYTADGAGCGNANTLRLLNDDNSQADVMCEVAGVNYEQREKESCCASSLDDHLGGRVVLVVQSSPVPADGLESPAEISPPTTSVCNVSTAESANFVQNSRWSSPNHSQEKTAVCMLVDDEEKIELLAPQDPKAVGRSSDYADAHAALSSFEGLLRLLTRTKESIARATRVAIDCTKFGVSSKVVEILAQALESEPSLHRRVDLFFLVDSITQCSRGLKGDVGGIYPAAIQAMLPRLLSAAAPPGSSAQENRRQCLKVLRLWLERKILPEYIIRQHLRELDSLGCSTIGAYSRRSARTERSFDDPVRDMEGMLVDEYGSNSSFQLPGFCMPRMLKDEDEGTDSDGESFEAVTPEHNSKTPEAYGVIPSTEKHTHILEDVDGELEMEDVAPPCEVELSSTGSIGVHSVLNSQSQLEENFSLPFAPPLPQDVPPLSPPLPTSPPPPLLLPLPPAGPPGSGIAYPHVNVDSKLYTNLHDLHGDLRESVAPIMHNGMHPHPTECRDQMQVQHCDTTSSFNSYPVFPLNNVQHTDGPNVHHKAYPPRPPHAQPPNQFSYPQAAQLAKSHRPISPPSYHNRYPSSHNADGGNFYTNHDRMRPAPYEESCRYHPSTFHGPRYPNKPYAPGSYGDPQREPNRIPHQGWSLPSQGMYHRNFMPSRSPEIAVPAPSIWQPR